jgi:O-6-methylguanine DNA methyltransferase
MKNGSIHFKDKVLTIVRAIPKGQTRSYGQVARLAGNSGASRAVGALMAKNDDTTVPCHRVIRADGTIGEYNGLRGAVGPKGKLALLVSEGYESKS